MMSLGFLLIALGFVLSAIIRKDLRTLGKVLHLVLAVFFVIVAIGDFVDNYQPSTTKLTNQLIRGISQKDVAQLEPICLNGIAQKILNEVYRNKEGGHIIVTSSKLLYHSFGSKVEWELYVLLKDEKDAIPERWMKLDLKKRLGGWKIKDFKMGSMDQGPWDLQKIFGDTI